MNRSRLPSPTPTSPSRQGARTLARLSCVGLGALGLGLSACVDQAAAELERRTPGQAKQREAIHVRTAEVERREMLRVLRTTTQIESEKEIRIIPRRAGNVTELRVEEGDAVETGAVLAVLDKRESEALLQDLEAAVAEAEIGVAQADFMAQESVSMVESRRLAYEQAARDFERNEKAGLISEFDLDQSRLSRDTAKGEYEQAQLAQKRSEVEKRVAASTLRRAELTLERERLNHSWLEITAPFAGVIASRSIRVGDTVGTSEPAFVLTDTELLRAVFFRPQRELGLFSSALGPGAAPNVPGAGSAEAELELSAEAEAYPGFQFSGRILRVSPSVDAETGAFRVTARLEQPSGVDDEGRPMPRLLPGMLVRLKIITDRHEDALVVPKRSIQREGEDVLLYAVRDGKASEVRVEEGYSDDDHLEVTPLSGFTLAEGERVVVVGNRDLEDGAQVIDQSLEPKEDRAAAGDDDGDGDGNAETAAASTEGQGVAGGANGGSTDGGE